MKKFLLSAALATSILLTGCASVDFMQYSNSDQVMIGQGGAFSTSDGIEIWKNGAPQKPFRILGIINSSITEGVGAQTMLESAVVSKAKKVGADAVIVIDAQYQPGSGAYSGPSYWQPSTSSNAGTAFWDGANSGSAMASSWLSMASAYGEISIKFYAIKYVTE